MKSILKQGRVPKNLQTDHGKEFFNKHFENFIVKLKINHYSTYSTLKASIVERFNRTLKSMMWKEFSMNGNYKWINLVNTLVKTYNHTYHRTIKMRPRDVNVSSEQRLLSTVYKHKNKHPRSKYHVGDHVRISKYKHVFEKGYTPNWTTEIFTVREVKNTDPVTYLLEDHEQNPIKGGFYELELTKTQNPNIYLVEKVLRQSGDKVFVKWLGFPSKDNSWINKKDLL